MTSKEIQSEILSTTSRISELKKEVDRYSADLAQAIAYRDSALTDPWRGKSESKKKELRETTYNNRQASVTANQTAYNNAKQAYDNANNQLSSLQTQLASTLAAEQASIQTLAEKGQTLESVAIKAQGEAQARNTTAQAEGVALLQKTEVDNSNAKKAKNVQLIIILSVSAIVLTAVAIIVIRKLKKKQ